MHHKCEGKYLVLVSSGGGSVTYRSVSGSYESLYSTLFTRLMEAHLCISGHRDLSLDVGSVVSAYDKGILGAPAFYII